MRMSTLDCKLQFFHFLYFAAAKNKMANKVEVDRGCAGKSETPHKLYVQLGSAELLDFTPQLSHLASQASACRPNEV